LSILPDPLAAKTGGILLRGGEKRDGKGIGWEGRGREGKGQEGKGRGKGEGRGEGPSNANSWIRPCIYWTKFL